MRDETGDRWTSGSVTPSDRAVRPALVDTTPNVRAMPSDADGVIEPMAGPTA